MTKDEYAEYLKTPHWLVTRQAALERAGRRCQVCNGAKFLQVHHRTYERVGCELPNDLTVLCDKCHGLFHENRSLSRGKRPKLARKVKVTTTAPVVEMGLTMLKPPKKKRDKPAPTKRDTIVMPLAKDIRERIELYGVYSFTTKQMAYWMGRSTDETARALVQLKTAGVLSRPKKVWRVVGKVQPANQLSAPARADADRLAGLLSNRPQRTGVGPNVTVRVSNR